MLEIIPAVQGLLEIIGMQKGAMTSKVEAVCALLLEVCDALDAAYDELAKGFIPHGYCAKMQIYLEQLPAMLPLVFHEAKAVQTLGTLIQVLQLERLGNQPSQEDLKQLAVGIGMIRAHAQCARTLAKIS